MHSTKYTVIGEWPSKDGGSHDRLTDVDVISFILGCPGGSGHLKTVNLAEDEVCCPFTVILQVYSPSSLGTALSILRVHTLPEV